MFKIKIVQFGSKISLFSKGLKSNFSKDHNNNSNSPKNLKKDEDECKEKKGYFSKLKAEFKRYDKKIVTETIIIVFGVPICYLIFLYKLSQKV